MTYLMEKARNGRNAALASLPVNTNAFMAAMDRTDRSRATRAYGAISFVSKRSQGLEVSQFH